MKRKIFLIIIMTLFLGFAGCMPDSESAAATETEQMLKDILECFDNNDADRLKNMFS